MTVYQETGPRTKYAASVTVRTVSAVFCRTVTACQFSSILNIYHCLLFSYIDCCLSVCLSVLRLAAGNTRQLTVFL
jgi:hypothetical protein